MSDESRPIFEVIGGCPRCGDTKNLSSTKGTDMESWQKYCVPCDVHFSDYRGCPKCGKELELLTGWVSDGTRQTKQYCYDCNLVIEKKRD